MILPSSKTTIGVFSTWFYNYLMVGIAQGTQKTIRDEMFEKMQSLPIRYFDTHTHGDVMSCYTNDTDTLRQMIAQSLSQMISSICMVVAVFCCMLYQSIYLTLIVVVMLFFIMKLVKVIGGKSGFYFIKQQQTLGGCDTFHIRGIWISIFQVLHNRSGKQIDFL